MQDGKCKGERIYDICGLRDLMKLAEEDVDVELSQFEKSSVNGEEHSQPMSDRSPS